METSDRRSYTKEERDAVLGDVPALGVAGAAQKHGVPKTTAVRWAAAAGVRREAAAPASARKPKATRKPKAKAAREAKGAPADESVREEPVAASEPAAAEPPVRRTLKSRVARVYTPSQKALILEDATKLGVVSRAG